MASPPPPTESRAGVLLGYLAVLFVVCAPLRAEPLPESGTPAAQRVVSMNPSLTETLLALGARENLVGVDEFSLRRLPDVRGLPAVGGLFSPSVEAVTALSPDLVVLVPSAQQRSFRTRIEALGIRVLALPNISLDDLLTSIEVLGEAVGRRARARAMVNGIREEFALLRRATRDRPVSRCVLVLQRDPLYVVGGDNFIDSMLTLVGGHNVAAVFAEPYPQIALEWLVAQAPEVILDASEDPMPAAEYWARWPSLPAVTTGRVRSVSAGEVTRPGPYVGAAARALASALHGVDVVAGEVAP